MLHKAQARYLTLSPGAAISTITERRVQVAGGVLSSKVIQSRTDTVSGADAFRNRMKQQCHQIRQYRQSVLRESGLLLSPNEAALEWIERYAATFDCGKSGE